MCLINTIVLFRNESSIIADELPLALFGVIDTPVIEDIIVSSSCCRSLCGVGCSVYGFSRRGDSTETCAVGCDRIIDRYFILFPDRIHGMIGIILIRSDLSDYTGGICSSHSICAGKGFAIPHDPCCKIIILRKCAGIYCSVSIERSSNSRPAHEGVSGSGESICGPNIHSLVDSQRLINNQVARTTVGIPIHCSRRRLFGRNIFRTKLDGIFLGISAGSRIREIFHLCVARKDSKRIAREDLRARNIYELCAIPLLHDPIAKLQSGIRRSCGSTGCRWSIIHIGVRI